MDVRIVLPLAGLLEEELKKINIGIKDNEKE